MKIRIACPENREDFNPSEPSFHSGHVLDLPFMIVAFIPSPMLGAGSERQDQRPLKELNYSEGDFCGEKS